MPSSITHTYFGMDVYDKLNAKIKDRFCEDIELYKMFCQGPDVLYFYNNFIGKEAKKIFDLGSTVHTKDTRCFFKRLIYYINDNNLYGKSSVVSFLYGYMCHYFLDSMCHPFIFYKTGKFNSKDVSSYKYNALHFDMEFFIDRYMIHDREKINPCKYKIHKMFLNVNGMDSELKKCINYAYSIFYDNDKDDMWKVYLKSINDMRLFFRIISYDYFGIKKKVYSFIDSFTPKWITKIKSFSYRGDYEKKKMYLNMDHDKWFHPCDKKISYTYSFFDLYNMAIDKCEYAIEEVDRMLSSGNINERKLNVIFKNLSYLTGLDCDSKLELKYFEF
jgi:hypothetical protein